MNFRGLVADKIHEVIAEYEELGVSLKPSEIRGRDRSRVVCAARREVVRRCKATGLMRHCDIGAELGGRGHDTIHQYLHHGPQTGLNELSA